MARTFFVIVEHEGRNPETIRLFTEAAHRIGVKMVVLYADQYDYSRPQQIKEDDLLYRAGTERQSVALFRHIVSTCTVTVVFDDARAAIYRHGGVESLFMQLGSDLPINRTIFSVPEDRAVISSYVESLGGYPVIVKVVGGSHGVGVMRFDSSASLFAGLDFLRSRGEEFILREFIEHDTHARLIVLGDEVIDSIEYKRTLADFRTNVGPSPAVAAKRYSKEIEDIAIRATHVLGSQFGGVDIMIGRDGNPHIAEVNIPCHFARAQQISGVDIAGKIIEYLLEK